MRPRNKKNLESRLDNCENYLVTEPELMKGSWKKEFSALHVEIGCGKGNFICGMAEKNPDVLFVGIEMVKNVIVTAAEKLMAAQLPNVRLINGNALYMGDYFADGEIDTLYLNFSDPWPRDKQSKHRLTSERFMPLYIRLLRDRGRIVQKTDNRPLFDYSLEVYRRFRCDLKRVSFDLHGEPWYGESGNVVTEYENRFTELGTPICYADVTLPDREEFREEIRAVTEEIEFQKVREAEAMERYAERRKERANGKQKFQE